MLRILALPSREEFLSFCTSEHSRAGRPVTTDGKPGRPEDSRRFFTERVLACFRLLIFVYLRLLESLGDGMKPERECSVHGEMFSAFGFLSTSRAACSALFPSREV